jgi:exonuclease SbcC
MEELQDKIESTMEEINRWEKFQQRVTASKIQLEKDKATLLAEKKLCQEEKAKLPKEKPDVEFLAEHCRQLKQKQEEQLELEQQVISLLTHNKDLLPKLNELKDEQLKARNQYLSIKRLSDTANGKIPGKYRVDFEKYVQGHYFKKVVRAANIRFINMTNGKFELLAKEGGDDLRSQTGLDLEIKDYYSGMVRSVSSLSGGESFKAALSLSLGMSDVIQQFAGGIQMDAMFVDEGFGSLDSDSLEQAIKVLCELSGGNRLVGIISHVQELKDRIQNQVVVTKTENGSTVRQQP